MRDQYDARMWVAHHDQFSRSIVHALASAGALLNRLSSAAVASQLLAVTAAASLTLLTFGASAA